jgi:Pyruvate/2-oxoacid:ferredoxin oxidoreductase delta subunit
MSEIKKAFVDVHACGGCGLCVGVCPTGGILMVPKDSVGER